MQKTWVTLEKLHWFLTTHVITSPLLYPPHYTPRLIVSSKGESPPRIPQFEG